MSELEIEIGKTLGASAFFVYQYVKHNPGATQNMICIDLGLSTETVHRVMINLVDTKVVTQLEKRSETRARKYKENEAKETWKFH